MIAPGRKALFQKIRDEAARDLMDGRGDRGGDVPTSTSSESDGRKLNFRDSSGGVTSSTANISNQWKRHSEDESR
jgi:hypothetical protein